jgi:hypothetical protein
VQELRGTLLLDTGKEVEFSIDLDSSSHNYGSIQRWGALPSVLADAVEPTEAILRAMLELQGSEPEQPRPAQLQPMALAEQQSARRRVRLHGETTSLHAALSLTSESVARFYTLIHVALRTPMTDDELRHHLSKHNVRHTRSGVSARRSELEHAGWVRKTGERRPSDAGRPSNVYEAVEPRAAAAAATGNSHDPERTCIVCAHSSLSHGSYTEVGFAGLGRGQCGMVGCECPALEVAA